MGNKMSASRGYDNAVLMTMQVIIQNSVAKQKRKDLESLQEDHMIYGFRKKECARKFFRLSNGPSENKTVCENILHFEAMLTSSVVVNKHLLEELLIHILGRVGYFSFKDLLMATEVASTCIWIAVRYGIIGFKPQRSLYLENKIDMKSNAVPVLGNCCLSVQDFQKNDDHYYRITRLLCTQDIVVDPIFIIYGENSTEKSLDVEGEKSNAKRNLTKSSMEFLLFTQCKQNTMAILDFKSVKPCKGKSINAAKHNINIPTDFSMNCNQNTMVPRNVRVQPVRHVECETNNARGNDIDISSKGLTIQKNEDSFYSTTRLLLSQEIVVDTLFIVYGENRVFSLKLPSSIKCNRNLMGNKLITQPVKKDEASKPQDEFTVYCTNADWSKCLLAQKDITPDRNILYMIDTFLLKNCKHSDGTARIEWSSLKLSFNNYIMNCLKVIEIINVEGSCLPYSCLLGNQFVNSELTSNFVQSEIIQISRIRLNVNLVGKLLKICIQCVKCLPEQDKVLDTYMNIFVYGKYHVKHIQVYPIYSCLNDLSSEDGHRFNLCLTLLAIIATICLSIVHQRYVKVRRVIDVNVSLVTFTFVVLSMSNISKNMIQIPRRKQLYKYISSVLQTCLAKHDLKLKNRDILKTILGHHQYRRNDSYVVCPVTNPQQTNTCMSNELLRLGSLYNYPTENCPSLIRLASSGFYYEGKGREVRCFSCDVLHEEWSYGSDPFEIHRRISPNCGYLNQYFPVAQTPSLHDSSRNPLQIIKPQVAEQEVVTKFSNPDSIVRAESGLASDQFAVLASSSHQPVLTKSYVDSGYASNGSSTFWSRSSSLIASRNRSLVTSRDSGYGSNSSLDHSSLVQNGDIQADHIHRKTQLPVINEGNRENDTSISVAAPRPKYPEYEPVERRRATYKNWPENVHFLHPLDLSECGFFYSNFGDCVRCFQCGIGLRNWESDDNPWVEHARWSRKCDYLLHKKGQGFIDSVLTVLGLQTDAEIEQSRGTPSEPLIPPSTGNSTGPQSQFHVDGDPLTHEAAKYVIREKIFGSNLDLVKRGINQLLQEHDWRSITRDMLVLHILEHQNGIEYMETNDQNQTAGAKELSVKQPTKLSLSNNSNEVSNDKTSSTSNSSGENAEQIQKENEELKDLYTCKICLDEKVGITFVPCGHLVTCKNCSPKIRRCPLCRTFIRGTIKTTI